MNYEKTDWDWGYLGKVAGSCMAALGLAAGLAMFTSNKSARTEPLEKIVEKQDDIKVPISIPELGLSASKYIDELDANDEDTLKVDDIKIEASPLYKNDPLAISAQEAYKNGNCQIKFRYENSSEAGTLKIGDKAYWFDARNGRVTSLSDKNNDYELLDKTLEEHLKDK